ncbi:DOMON domain-containing protein frrs1L [Mactra antiquata]
MLFIAVICGTCMVISGFPTGAPDLACKEMVPFHPKTTVTGDNPFMLKISSDQYQPGDTITGELYSAQNLTFRGFLIEVGTASTASEKEEGVGEFINIDSSIQRHACGKGNSSTEIFPKSILDRIILN